jgi:hypothetical protein
MNDGLLGPNLLCGHAPPSAYQDRCGYGARLPMLAISPYAKVNFVDHSVTDQSSILQFIEDNWNLGRIGDVDMKLEGLTKLGRIELGLIGGIVLVVVIMSYLIFSIQGPTIRLTP